MNLTVSFQIDQTTYNQYIIDNGQVPVTELAYDILDFDTAMRQRIYTAAGMLSGTWKPKLLTLDSFGVAQETPAVFNVVYDNLVELLDELDRMQQAQDLKNLEATYWLRVKVMERVKALQVELNTNELYLKTVYLDWPVTQTFMQEVYDFWKEAVDKHNKFVYDYQKELQQNEENSLLTWALNHGSERLRKLATMYEIDVWRSIAVEEKAVWNWNGWELLGNRDFFSYSAENIPMKVLSVIDPDFVRQYGVKIGTIGMEWHLRMKWEGVTLVSPIPILAE